ncbi:hypothetical protein V6N00_12595 [Tersicoccus sp. MR15.9]|uniref:hypothetical protein n=1 Tax=Tersicoccus mangrovi TaxID=3121635 RepID=UPI002FE62490
MTAFYLVAYVLVALAVLTGAVLTAVRPVRDRRPVPDRTGHPEDWPVPAPPTRDAIGRRRTIELIRLALVGAAITVMIAQPILQGFSAVSGMFHLVCAVGLVWCASDGITQARVQENPFEGLVTFPLSGCLAMFVVAVVGKAPAEPFNPWWLVPTVLLALSALVGVGKDPLPAHRMVRTAY